MDPPSCIRNAASSARDWSYVERWLEAKFGPSKAMPAFERSSATLQAILNIIASNEAADEVRALAARVSAAPLVSQNLKVQSQRRDAAFGADEGDSADDVCARRHCLLKLIENNMAQDGVTALEALARSWICLAAANTDTHSISKAYMTLQKSVFQTAQLAARVDTLNKHMESERQTNLLLLDSLKSWQGLVQPDLEKTNDDLQLKVKSASERISCDAASKAAAESSPAPAYSMNRAVIQEEKEFIQLMDRKRELEAHVASLGSR